jgi:two-component system nitrate/nitrite response regulator NarL
MHGTSAVADEPFPEGTRSSAGQVRVLVASSDLMVSDLLTTALGVAGFDAHSSMPVGSSNSWRPDVALLEVDGADHTATMELIGRIRRANVPVAVMLRERTPSSIEMCLNAGAASVIDIESPLASLLEQLRRLTRSTACAIPESEIIPIPASATQRKFPADDPFESARRAPFNILTPRERAVLAELMEGHPAEAIARNGWVAVSTVRSQIKAILQKLGVNSQLAAVAMARQVEWWNEE